MVGRRKKWGGTEKNGTKWGGKGVNGKRDRGWGYMEGMKGLHAVHGSFFRVLHL